MTKFEAKNTMVIGGETRGVRAGLIARASAGAKMTVAGILDDKVGTNLGIYLAGSGSYIIGRTHLIDGGYS